MGDGVGRSISSLYLLAQKATQPLWAPTGDLPLIPPGLGALFLKGVLLVTISCWSSPLAVQQVWADARQAASRNWGMHSDPALLSFSEKEKDERRLKEAARGKWNVSAEIQPVFQSGEAAPGCIFSHHPACFYTKCAQSVSKQYFFPDGHLCKCFLSSVTARGFFLLSLLWAERVIQDNLLTSSL